ncbi:hypothetical protein ACFX13_036673 [Malus domestica]
MAKSSLGPRRFGNSIPAGCSIVWCRSIDEGRKETIGDAFLMTIDIYIQALELGSIEQVQDKEIGYRVFKGLGDEAFERKHCCTGGVKQVPVDVCPAYNSDY